MPAEAAYLMRAFRSIDGSFHTWRAGDFDTDMSDTTPPFSPGDYSDFVLLGFVGGPLARSDADAFTVAGLGTSGVPVTYAIDSGPATAQTTPGTDCRDFESISCWVVVTTVGTATTLTVSSLWTNTSSPSGAADLGFQRSDDAIVDGDSPQNSYRAIYSFSGAPSQALGPYNVPVRGRRHLLTVATDTGDLQGYVLVMRMA